MIVIPAIDILGGSCVRLVRGEYGTASKVAPDPLETALYFRSCGAKYVHMVDLDGAREGKTVNAELICHVARYAGVKIELGGGIRDLNTIEYYLSNGISRCILGSVALQNPALVREAVKKYGDKIAVGIDAKNRRVAVSGWTVNSDMDYIRFARMMRDEGVDNIIFTDIDRDGTQTGANLEQLGELTKAVSCKITASGGVNDMNDIKRLCEMDVYGAIVGKAIYAGSLDLLEAINYTRDIAKDEEE